MLSGLSQPEATGAGRWEGHRLNDRLPRSVIPPCTVVPKSIAQLNDEAVTAFGMQALVEAENIFGEPGSSRPAAAWNQGRMNSSPFSWANTGLWMMSGVPSARRYWRLA